MMPAKVLGFCHSSSPERGKFTLVTPLPSLILFSENGHMVRRNWLFGGGGDSLSDENLIFRSRLSLLRSCAFTSLQFNLRFLVGADFNAGTVSIFSKPFSEIILHVRNGPKGVSQHFHE
jgi:hypothetical protein